MLKHCQTSAVLIDFENAKDNTIDMTATATRTGVVGTRVYMAPELPKAPASSDTDMYSIGVVLLLAFSPECIEEVEADQRRPLDVVQEEGQRLQLYGWLIVLLKKLLPWILVKQKKL